MPLPPNAPAARPARRTRVPAAVGKRQLVVAEDEGDGGAARARHVLVFAAGEAGHGSAAAASAAPAGPARPARPPHVSEAMEALSDWLEPARTIGTTLVVSGFFLRLRNDITVFLAGFVTFNLK